MYFLLTGDDPEPITRSDLTGNVACPMALAQIIARATEPDASKRYSSARELKLALQAYAESSLLRA
jgi:hypothetical protein